MFDRVMVPLDGSRFGEHALPHALAVASRDGAILDLVNVAAPGSAQREPGKVVGEEARERGAVAARSYLEEVQERVRGAGFAGPIERTVLSAGNVANSLVRHAAEAGAGLTVMTTHGRGPLRRAWLGSTADGFLRSSSIPILLLRPPEDGNGERPEPGPAPGPFARVLVPLDGSESAEGVLRFLGPLADPDASILLLRVTPQFFAGGSPYMPHVVLDEQEQRKVREAAGAYLDGLAKGLEEEGFDVEARVTTAPQPAMAILQAIDEEGVELVTLSTSGRGGVARLLIGSVADKIVRGSPVPMLVYRKPEEE